MDLIGGCVAIEKQTAIIALERIKPEFGLFQQLLSLLLCLRIGEHYEKIVTYYPYSFGSILGV